MTVAVLGFDRSSIALVVDRQWSLEASAPAPFFSKKITEIHKKKAGGKSSLVGAMVLVGEAAPILHRVEKDLALVVSRSTRKSVQHRVESFLGLWAEKAGDRISWLPSGILVAYGVAFLLEDGYLVRVDHDTAMGCGAAIATGALAAYKRVLPQAGALERAVAAVEITCENNSFCGGGIDHLEFERVS